MDSGQFTVSVFLCGVLWFAVSVWDAFLVCDIHLGHFIDLEFSAKLTVLIKLGWRDSELAFATCEVCFIILSTRLRKVCFFMEKLLIFLFCLVAVTGVCGWLLFCFWVCFGLRFGCAGSYKQTKAFRPTAILWLLSQFCC